MKTPPRFSESYLSHLQIAVVLTHEFSKTKTQRLTRFSVSRPDRRRRSCEAYRAELRAQVQQQQQRRSDERRQQEKELQQGRLEQQVYDHRRDRILARTSHLGAATHPFRRSAPPALAEQPPAPTEPKA